MKTANLKFFVLFINKLFVTIVSHMTKDETIKCDN